MKSILQTQKAKSVNADTFLLEKGLGSRANSVWATQKTYIQVCREKARLLNTFRSIANELGTGETVNYGGSRIKSLKLSVADSIRKLQTDYTDLIYVHRWDGTTSIEELMDPLYMLVQQGKVLYLGISDTPAWVVSAANVYAKTYDKTPFSVYQSRWDLMLRDFERDIIPMGLCPWDILQRRQL